MKVVLTGATGFLGSHLLRHLSEMGHEILVVKRSSSNIDRIRHLIGKFTVCDIDSISDAQLLESLKGNEVIIHTATNYGRHGETPSQVFEANTAFPLRLLDAGVRSGVCMFINTDTVLDKHLNLYSFSKNQFLQWGQFFSKNEKIKFINVKLEHFYGAFDDSSKFTQMVFASCLSNKPLHLTLGEQTRDFIFINDVISAYQCLLMHGVNFSDNFSEFELGTGLPVSIRSFVELVHRCCASSSQLHFGALPYREGEVMHSAADIDRLKRLGWVPQYSLEDGINHVIELFRKQEI
jgi:CDP-paratose synthetase